MKVQRESVVCWSRVDLAIIALVLSLSGKAAAGDGLEASSPSCSPIMLPLERHGFDITVPVEVHGVTVQFDLDLGASDSYVLDEGRTRLALPPTRDPPRWTVDDIKGARTQTEFVLVASIKLGGVELGPRTMPVTKLGYPPGSDAQQSEMGLLGTDFLTDFDLDLDPPGNRLTLYPIAAYCPAPPLIWSAAAASVPLRFLHGGSPLVPVSVNGREIEAVFDTGSERTRIKDPSRGLDGELRPLGLLGRADTATSPLREVRLALGEAVETGFPVRVAEADGALGGRSFLGIDFIRQRRFWLSRRLNRLFISTRSVR